MIFDRESTFLMINFLFIEAIPRPEDPFMWVSVVIMLSLVLIAYVRQRNDSISVSIVSFFNLRFFKQSIREETNASLKYSRILLYNSFIILAIILNHFIGKDIGEIFEVENVLTFLVLFCFVLTWYFINIGIKKVVSLVSNIKSIELEHQRYDQYFFQTLGMFLLPGVIGLYFFPTFISGHSVVYFVEIYIKLVVVLLLLNKIIQSVLQSFEIKISWHYIFLYICTLEILPLSIGFQLLVK